ncbi:MAG: Tfx family DNA-binding protein [Nitrososphaerota archaeon]|nr:Tfx family DNA-binding protein [Nitrososphaerota archaeon]
MNRMKTFERTNLTQRQWEVIRYRTQGLTQADIAEKLETTRENVNEIEHHARLNIEAAKATMAALQELNANGEVLVARGMSIFEAVSLVMLRADILGVRLMISGDDLLATMRSKWRNRISGHHLTSVCRARIGNDGSLSFSKDK